MSNSLIVRVQSADHGTKRIQSKPTERINEFIEKVKTEFGLSDDGFSLYINRDKTGEIMPSRSKVLSSYKIRHGDMIYMYPNKGSTSSGDVRKGSIASISSLPDNGLSKSRTNSLMVIEDEVDQFLSKQDGRIPRQRNEQFCHHGPQGKCLHCVPLEPYDEQYLQSADPPIKFLSFHSNIRKLMGGADKGKFAMLENISVQIKSGCTSHPPWPEGICTKCQPNAVTLNRQRYRHVDYIQFENPFLMEKFLNYWRNTGNQRIGLMYGRYEHHKDVPLGIKAVVAAIYEPPQTSSRSSVELLEDPKEEAVNDTASKLGLVPVGWIFTDLVAQDLQKGTVKHFRGTIDSHFLSAEECIMSAEFQNKHTNPCKLSPDGHFGSKFVTVVVTGDKDNQIHFEGYQVSNQCMALVRDDVFIPTIDAPELGYVKESSNSQYVPDVFFKEKDEYGNEVTQLARPLPVEYLLVDLPAAFPVEPLFTFQGGANVKPFPIENRETTGELQEFNEFAGYLQQFGREDFLKAVSDFHLLVFMATCDMLPLKEQMSSLLEAVRNKDDTLAHHWSKTEEWATVEQMIEAHAPSQSASGSSTFAEAVTSNGASGGGSVPSGDTAATWTCKHCTFINNPTNSSCEMCSLPR